MFATSKYHFSLVWRNPLRTDRRTNAQRTELSDSRMLEAAIHLIVTKGPDNTTLKEVGETAGYSRGLAGYRFGSKPGLFEFVVRSVSEVWLGELTQATQGLTGFAAISAATDAHYEFCVNSPDSVRAFYTLWFEAVGPDSEVKTVIHAIHDRRRKDVAKWILEDESLQKLRISPDAVARHFSSAIIGIVYQWLLHGDDLTQTKNLHESLKQTMALLLGLDQKGQPI